MRAFPRPSPTRRLCRLQPVRAGPGCADLGVQDELPGAGEGRALHGHRPRVKPGRRLSILPGSKSMHTRKTRPRLRDRLADRCESRAVDPLRCRQRFPERARGCRQARPLARHGSCHGSMSKSCQQKSITGFSAATGCARPYWARTTHRVHRQPDHGGGGAARRRHPDLGAGRLGGCPVDGCR